MENRSILLRRATLADLAAVDGLLGRSYPKLLAADYPPSVMVLAVPRIARARPELLTSGTYFVAEDAEGRIIAAGGWTRAAPLRGTVSNVGNVRHVATDPGVTGRGIGRALLGKVMEDAGKNGMGALECLSTRTAVPFYSSLGFRTIGPVEVPLAPGIVFPAIRMRTELPGSSRG
jgi:N-acetylglutamate synthase-like GNAT family acetyltransferase